MDTLRLRADRPRPLCQANRFRSGLLGSFLLFSVLMSLDLAFAGGVFGAGARWPDALLLLAAAAATLAWLTTQVPWQNALAAAVLAGAFSSGAVMLGAVGILIYQPVPGPKLFAPLPWSMPLIWIVGLLNSRGTAQVLLAPWRHQPGHGYRLLGVAALLVVAWDMCLEPFATQVRDYWTWKPSSLAWSWCGTPLTHVLGWAVAAVLILTFVTPFLLNKSGLTLPTNYCPVAVWGGSNLVFLSGAATHHLWGVVGFGLAMNLAVALFAAGAFLRQERVPSSGQSKQ